MKINPSANSGQGEICAKCKKELHIEDSPVKISDPLGIKDAYRYYFYKCQLCYTGNKIFPGSSMGVQSKRNKKNSPKLKVGKARI